MTVLSSLAGELVQPDTAAGWYGLVLALLNVLQTLSLAYMAGRSRRVRNGKYEPSRSRQTPRDGRGWRRSSSSSATSSDTCLPPDVRCQNRQLVREALALFDRRRKS